VHSDPSRRCAPTASHEVPTTAGSAFEADPVRTARDMFGGTGADGYLDCFARASSSMVPPFAIHSLK
jgi:hypothetical protein